MVGGAVQAASGAACAIRIAACAPAMTARAAFAGVACDQVPHDLVVEAETAHEHVCGGDLEQLRRWTALRESRATSSLMPRRNIACAWSRRMQVLRQHQVGRDWLRGFPRAAVRASLVGPEKVRGYGPGRFAGARSAVGARAIPGVRLRRGATAYECAYRICHWHNRSALRAALPRRDVSACRRAQPVAGAYGIATPSGRISAMRTAPIALFMPTGGWGYARRRGPGASGRGRRDAGNRARPQVLPQPLR